MPTRRLHKHIVRSAERGLTLLEAGIALAVTATIAASAAPSLAGFIDGRRLEGVATQLAADIQFVRGEAVLRNRALRLSFHTNSDSSCWIVHTGAFAQCTCAADTSALCSGGAVAIRSATWALRDRVAVSANVASIVFDPLHGTSTPTGTIAVSDSRGRSLHQIVNVLGRVRSCSAGVAVPGYRAC